MSKWSLQRKRSQHFSGVRGLDVVKRMYDIKM
jgi:hypothetical protein